MSCEQCGTVICHKCGNEIERCAWCEWCARNNGELYFHGICENPSGAVCETCFIPPQKLAAAGIPWQSVINVTLSAVTMLCFMTAGMLEARKAPGCVPLACVGVFTLTGLFSRAERA